jgi:hypothetical protein
MANFIYTCGGVELREVRSMHGRAYNSLLLLHSLCLTDTDLFACCLAWPWLTVQW